MKMAALLQTQLQIEDWYVSPPNIVQLGTMVKLFIEWFRHDCTFNGDAPLAMFSIKPHYLSVHRCTQLGPHHESPMCQLTKQHTASSLLRKTT